ncbi:JUN kinase kinase kinase activity protein [Homalodisca vitripennis]|nr:JUN kinase kinase kinase activity protein [Homalodisca vitripennis]
MEYKKQRHSITLIHRFTTWPQQTGSPVTTTGPPAASPNPHPEFVHVFCQSVFSISNPNSFAKRSSLVYECWRSDPHLRPGFEDILLSLDAIVHSAFTQTPHESFHTMQDGWRIEIEEVLNGLRMKEKAFRSKEEELRCREEELTKAQLEQKMVEQKLQQREAELARREIDLLQRELHIIITQQAPTPKKRRGVFKQAKLKQLKKEPGQISFPVDFRHTITVQHTPKSHPSPNSPPGSPSIPRLRAIAHLELNICAITITFYDYKIQVIRGYGTIQFYYKSKGVRWGCVVPADGVKGKTWGPSTCHQRERGQIMNRPKRWSKSAPNLEKPARPRAFLDHLFDLRV